MKCASGRLSMKNAATLNLSESDLDKPDHLRKNVVISGVNLTNSGPLSILHECVNYAAIHLNESFRIIVLVNNADLIKKSGVTVYEFPWSKKSWFFRLYYEYYFFLRLSKRLKPYLWLSLHDITPKIKSKIQAVYCHNPSPFYRISAREIILDPKFALFNLFYKYLYKINIRKNDFVIVQQEVMRRRFGKLYGLSNIVVAHPQVNFYSEIKKVKASDKADKTIFFFPAFPRVFKNFEVVCRAACILTERGINNFEVCFTFSGSENWYARHIYRKYRKIKNIKFMGLLSRDKVFEFYTVSDCLVFPSRLETWGMPITEFKLFDKPILLADAEYARETLGDYSKGVFFNSADYVGLAHKMEGFMKNELNFLPIKSAAILQPYAENWNELFKILLAGNPDRV